MACLRSTARVTGFVTVLLAGAFIAATAAAQTPLMHGDDARIPTDALRAQRAAETVPVSGDYRIDALLGPCQWTPGSTITYSFYSNAVFNGTYYGSEQVSEVSARVKANVRAIMPVLASLMNLTFVEVAETSTTIGRIRFLKSPAPAYAYTYYPCSTDMFSTAGDVFLNDAYDRLGDTNGFQNTAGYHGYVSLIHEIGHAVGLKHPHDLGGSGVTLPAQEDTHTQTVMSYNFKGDSPATMMGYDLLALQYLYGARAKNAGATTYRFTRSNVDQFAIGGTLSVNPSGPTKLAIWDSSGPNTLDFSSITPLASGYRIDTRPLGFISSVSAYSASPLYLVDGAVVGPGVSVDTVISSPGDDTIYANTGTNTFAGYGPGRTVGHDVIIGADADDVIDLTLFAPNGVVQTVSGNDLIVTFDASNNLRIKDFFTTHPAVRFQSVVTVDSVAPATGTGLTQTFTFKYSDSNGASRLQAGWAWFAADQSTSAHSCLVSYDVPARQFKLLDDAGTVWSSGAAGAATVLRNTQCSVSLSAASVSSSGDTVTMVVPVTFASGYAGPKNIYGFASSQTGTSSGWQDLGDWQVGNPVIVDTEAASPSSGTGTAQTFALRYSDSYGARDLTTAWVWFAPALSSSSAHSCLVYYASASNAISLLDDAGTTWMPGTAGSSGTLRNSQCTLSLAGTSIVANGNTLTITAPVNFSGGYAGAKNIYLFAASSTGVNTGWQDRGNWTVSPPSIAAESVTPSSGQGTAQTFSLRYSDSNGVSDLATAWAWFARAGTSVSAKSCLVYYTPSTNTISLLNDAGTAWKSATVGSAGTLENAQCAVSPGATTVVPSGNQLTVNAAMRFKAAYAGTMDVSLFAGTVSGSGSGWQARGTWTIPQAAIAADTVTPTAGTGATQAFGLRYTDSFGTEDLLSTWVWFSNALATSSELSCLIYYAPETQRISLLNDAANQWMSAPIGLPGTLQNGQCAVNVGASSAVTAGTDLNLSLVMTFQPAFGGDKQVYLFAASTSGVTTGWTTAGAWSIPAGTVTADSITPRDGEGGAQFVASYSDADGVSDLRLGWLWFAPSFASGGAHSCMMFVDPSAQTVSLLDDSGTNWMPGALASSGWLQNSQCGIDLAGSHLAGDGTTLEATLTIAFTPSFTGQKNVYLYAGAGSGGSGWQKRGSWTIP